MGSFYTSLHVRTDNRAAVVEAVKSGPSQLLPAYVSRTSTNGWVSIFPHSTEGQDHQLMQTLAGALSKHMNCAVFGMLVHDSDIFWYVLCENGKQVDLYDSDPGYFSGAPMPPRGGDSKKLAKYCLPETSILELNGILHNRSDETFAGDYLAEQVGTRLGLPDPFISAGFNHIAEKEEEGLENLELIGQTSGRDNRFLSLVSQDAPAESEPAAPPSGGLAKEPVTAGEVIADPLKFKVPQEWVGSVRKSPTGSILHLAKKSTNAELTIAVFSADVRYPIIPLDTLLQERLVADVGRMLADVESEDEVPLIHAGIRFRLKRFRARQDQRIVYGLIATGDSGKNRLLMVDAKTSSEADLDEVQDMLMSVERL